MFDVDVVINWLIERAKRTPYYHLDGYMLRHWLVPYRTVVKRKLPQQPGDYDIGSWDGVYPEPFETADGTGPVSPWRRPIAWLLQRFDISVRVHEILRSDIGNDSHDHPFNYLTIILRGGYFEQVFDDDGELISQHWHGPGSVLWRPKKTWHRLDVPEGTSTWTLFITDKKENGVWGYNVAGKKVNHRDHDTFKHFHG